MMKYPFAVIFLFCLLVCNLQLTDRNMTYEQQLMGKDNPVDFPLQFSDKLSMGDTFSMIPLQAIADDALAETYLLANQLCTRAVRLHRFASQQAVSILRTLARQISLYDASHMHQESHLYTTARCQNWHVSSEHYVFGMRRLLI